MIRMAYNYYVITTYRHQGKGIKTEERLETAFGQQDHSKLLAKITLC